MHTYAAEWHVTTRPVIVGEQRVHICRSKSDNDSWLAFHAGDELCCATLQWGDGLAVANRLISIDSSMQETLQQIDQAHGCIEPITLTADTCRNKLIAAATKLQKQTRERAKDAHARNRLRIEHRQVSFRYVTPHVVHGGYRKDVNRRSTAEQLLSLSVATLTSWNINGK